MRVLSISWEFPPHMVGGIGKHVADLLPVLGGFCIDNESIKVDLLTPHYGSGPAVEKLSEHVTIYRVEMPIVDALDHYNSVIANNAYFVDYAVAHLAEEEYDLIHIHEWLTGSAGIALKHEWKLPLLATIHGTERGRHQGYLTSHTSQQINQLEWQICYEAWRLIVCSQFMREELQRYFETPADKIDIIPNGVNTALDSSCTEMQLNNLRWRYAPNGERLLFFVGRMVYEKGVQVLIRAMPRILAKYPETKLLIAGKNGQKMWPLAYELGVERSIEFLGFISDRERDCIYRIVDAAIFPSLYEPFGIVALEAMACNCNVIVSHVGGLREVVEHLRNGLTVYPNDPLSVAW
ncbi:MAG: glycosyltransferase family 4 protein, partial [Caldilineaceae bacterium]|nr:glycosyltransferase family 4 protein [Caldilineaceae bacterium]